MAQFKERLIVTSTGKFVGNKHFYTIEIEQPFGRNLALLNKFLKYKIHIL